MSTRLGFNLHTHGYKNITRSLTPSEEKLLKKIFSECDEGNKHYLTGEDLKVAVVSLFGYKPSKYETREILEKFGDSSGTGEKVVNKSKFIEAMTGYIIKHDEDEDIRHTFLAFDTQCKGFLTFEDLHKVVKQVAPHLKPNVVETAFRELDRDGDKRISYKDFDFMMKFGIDL